MFLDILVESGFSIAALYSLQMLMRSVPQADRVMCSLYVFPFSTFNIQQLWSLFSKGKLSSQGNWLPQLGKLKQVSSARSHFHGFFVPVNTDSAPIMLPLRRVSCVSKMYVYIYIHICVDFLVKIHFDSSLSLKKFFNINI